MQLLIGLILGGSLAAAAVYLWKVFIGFRAQTPEDYADLGPVIDLRKHLNGKMICEGVIYGPVGRVVSRFVADMDIRWSGDLGVMREEFRYDSGDVQRREWHLTLQPERRLMGTAEDVIGKARGRQSGAAVCLRYRIRLEPDAGGHILDVVDWMYLLENGTIVNRSQFRKYGFKVAELVATMRKDA